jgi:tRNA G18 (ribose-2'-O)-methylase SpoU
MRKLRMEELGRLSPDAYRLAPKFPLRVLLDNVRSMHNVGAIFRSADAFRVSHLHLCGITPRPPHRDIHKTALGAEETVPWSQHEDLLPLLDQLKAEGYVLLCVEQAEGSVALPAFPVQARTRYAVIFGNEVEGVSAEAVARCDAAVEIPQYGTKHSLNVSVAAGIVLYHLATQGT